MSDLDQLIEEILDVCLLSLQAATTPQARREIMVVMNFVKAKRSVEHVEQLELEAMNRALGL